MEVLPRRMPINEEELSRVMHHVHVREVSQAQQTHQQNGGDDTHHHHGQGRVVLLRRAEVADRIGNRRYAGESDRTTRERTSQQQCERHTLRGVITLLRHNSVTGGFSHG